MQAFECPGMNLVNSVIIYNQPFQGAKILKDFSPQDLDPIVTKEKHF